MPRFPLPITWRCPSSHVALATIVVQHWNHGPRSGVPMQARPGAPLGLIAGNYGLWSTGDATLVSHPAQDDAGLDCAVLCRFNLPLVRLAFKLIARGFGCRLIGKRDFKKDLARLLDKFGKEPCGAPALVERIDRHCLDEALPAKKRAAADLEELRDLCDCLKVLLQRMPDAAQYALRAHGPDVRAALREAIELLFVPIGTEKRTIDLSTVHRAKGLEWHRTYVLQPKALPLAFVMQGGQPWERDQELNCVYVGLTRSKRDLIFLRHLNLKDNPESIVELLGEESFAEDEEDYWDDYMRQEKQRASRARKARATQSHAIQARQASQASQASQPEPWPAMSPAGSQRAPRGRPDDVPLSQPLTTPCARAVLGVSRGGGAEAVKRAWKRKVLTTHPDRIHRPDHAYFGRSAAEAGRAFRQAHAAYELLFPQ